MSRYSDLRLSTRLPIMNSNSFPIAIIGAGPVGLAAAAQLSLRNQRFILLEAGPRVGASIRKWSHVQVFSPWKYMLDEAARALLSRTSWVAPDDDGYPTGGELVSAYLEPLAQLPEIQPHLRVSTRVLSVARHGYDKLKSGGKDGEARSKAPFAITLETAAGEQLLMASAVIDASGTYEQPNPLGASGTPALGERALADRINYGIPDVAGHDRARYANKHVVVVGSGHSAFNTLIGLADLHARAPNTRITWAVRRSEAGQMFGGGGDDQLEARGALGTRVQSLITQGVLRMAWGFKIAQIKHAEAALAIVAEDGRTLIADEVIANTGFRPDLAMLGELRLDLDDRNEAPRALAPLIDPNLHSCGTVYPHGYNELKHVAEPGFYIVGMKSYGRAPTFLMLTGYEQVRSITAALAGDMQAALDVRLVLPETGVCSGPGGSCCATPAAASNLISLDTISFDAIPVAIAATRPINVTRTLNAAVAVKSATLVAMTPAATGCCGPVCCTDESTAASQPKAEACCDTACCSNDAV